MHVGFTQIDILSVTLLRHRSAYNRDYSHLRTDKLRAPTEAFSYRILLIAGVDINFMRRRDDIVGLVISYARGGPFIYIYIMYMYIGVLIIPIA